MILRLLAEDRPIPLSESPLFLPPGLQTHHSQALCESGGSVRGEELLRGSFGDTMGKRKFEVLGEELFDVWALNIGGLLDFDDFEDLQKSIRQGTTTRSRFTYMD